jgi:hypothetical protein
VNNPSGADVDWSGILEKIAIAVGTGIVSGAGGYVIATLRFEKKLPELITTASTALETKIVAMVQKSLDTHDAAVKVVLSAHSVSIEREKQMLSEQHKDLKGHVSKELSDLEQKIDKVERESSQELREFTREAGQRWTVVERTLGQIEGRLSAKSR